MTLPFPAPWLICAWLVGFSLMPTMALAAAPAPLTPELASVPVQTSAPADSPSPGPAPGAGLKAFIDADGALIEAPAGAGALRVEDFGLARPDYDLMWTEILPDGTRLLHTEGQVQMATLARIGADGQIEQVCLPTARTPTTQSEASR